MSNSILEAIAFDEWEDAMYSDISPTHRGVVGERHKGMTSHHSRPEWVKPQAWRQADEATNIRFQAADVKPKSRSKWARSGRLARSYSAK